jgi:divalent metal cation (Fe/Co/Zn/Cd) transporter
VWLKDFANYAIAHPLVTNLIGVFVLAVGGGIIVSQIPSIVWKSFSSEEDEITGETE